MKKIECERSLRNQYMDMPIYQLIDFMHQHPELQSHCPMCSEKTVFVKSPDTDHPKCLTCGYEIKEIAMPSDGFYVLRH